MATLIPITCITALPVEPDSKRKPNFTDSEKLFLVQQYEMYKPILSSKLCDAHTNRQKQEIWHKMTYELNIRNPHVDRSAKDVKKKWENLATQARREMIEFRQNGGSKNAFAAPPSSITVRILELLDELNLQNFNMMLEPDMAIKTELVDDEDDDDQEDEDSNEDDDDEVEEQTPAVEQTPTVDTDQRKDNQRKITILNGISVTAAPRQAVHHISVQPAIEMDHVSEVTIGSDSTPVNDSAAPTSSNYHIMPNRQRPLIPILYKAPIQNLNQNRPTPTMVHQSKAEVSIDHRTLCQRQKRQLDEVDSECSIQEPGEITLTTYKRDVLALKKMKLRLETEKLQLEKRKLELEIRYLNMRIVDNMYHQ